MSLGAKILYDASSEADKRWRGVGPGADLVRAMGKRSGMACLTSDCGEMGRETVPFFAASMLYRAR